MRKTAAWPLSQAYVALIVYASLYPFSGWRDQGIAPWAFLWCPWPKYWTAFDLVANVLGYMPFGLLIALSFLRRGNPRFVLAGNATAVAIAAGSAALLSFSMESLQSYLPSRVASNLDLALNAAGALGGALIAAALDMTGMVDRWNRVRGRWFVDEARGALVLLALWPFALLFPASVPFGLGQVLERREAGLADWLADTPFLEWLPVRDVELQPLVPAAELMCVTLGALIPCLLGYSVIRSIGYRAAFAVGVISLGIAATALSAALSWGPSHAWAWLSPPVQAGVAVALLLAFATLPISRRACAALVLLALVLNLSVLNQAPASAY